MEQYHGTTILSVRRGNRVAMGGDGQVTLGNIVIKASARKVRLIHQGRILAGFAGGTADAFTLFERFEAKLDKHQGNLLRSAVELAKDWRSDRALRRLQVAEETGQCLGFAFRDSRLARNPSPAALRVQVDTDYQLRVLKCRGGSAPARAIPFAGTWQ